VLSQEAEQIEGEKLDHVSKRSYRDIDRRAVGGAGAWFYFTTDGAGRVGDPPMLLEKKLAHGALNARIGKDPHTDPAPVPLNEATYLAGGDVYKENCAVCHGSAGEGKSNIAKGMFPSPGALQRQGGDRRSSMGDVLESEKWDPLDRYARVQGDAKRYADLAGQRIAGERR